MKIIHNTTTGFTRAMKTSFVTAILTNAIITATALAASFEGTHPLVKSASFSANLSSPHNKIVVLSKDGGYNWSYIAPTTLRIDHTIDIDVKYPGDVRYWSVYIGECYKNTGNCLGLPIVDWGHDNLNQRDLSTSDTIDISVLDIPAASFGPRNTDYINEIKNSCTHLMETKGKGQDHYFTKDMHVALTAYIDSDHGQDSGPTEINVSNTKPGDILEYHRYNPLTDGNYIRYATMPVQVQCVAHPVSEGPTRGPELPVFEILSVEDVNLYLSTFTHEKTHPDENTSCKRGRILVRAQTNGEGPVSMRLWTQEPGNAPIENEIINTWAYEVGSGNFEAEVIRWVETSETDTFQAKVEILNQGDFAPQDGWKDLTLECITDTPDLAPTPTNNDGTPGDKKGINKQKKFGHRLD